MRLLVILRGVSGTGKSTFVKGFEEYTLNPDKIRLAVAGVDYNEELGDIGISQGMDKAVWSILKEAIEYRMYDGKLIILDATFLRKNSMQPFVDLAKNYLYETLVLDFGNRPLTDNSTRGVASVPKSVVDRQVENYESSEVFVDPRGKRLSQILSEYMDSKKLLLDIKDNNKILVVGDIQGCRKPLEKLLSEFDENTQYIFVGDYLDRGDDEEYVLRTMIELSEEPNVTLLMGNHELHLRDYCMGKKARSSAFNNTTLPRISNISKSDIREFLNKMHDFVLIKTRENKHYIVSHAGLDVTKCIGYIPDFVLLPSLYFWKGVKGYTYLPKSFRTGIPLIRHINNFTFENVSLTQVFGHRNMAKDSYISEFGAVCLESSVEHGGYLSVYDLNENKIIRYDNSKSYLIKEEDLVGFTNKLTPYIDKKLINKKAYGHIDSYSFSSKAFYDKAWDSITTKVRGLFINNKTNKLVARGYDKFFNLGERGNTLDDLIYPVQVFTKENGFLGLISYDHEKEELFITSKTSPTSDFAGYLKDIIYQTVSFESIEFLTRYVKDSNTTFIFEVIDPVRDPHVVKYDKAHLVLLDVVHNTLEFKKESYETVKSIAKSLGVKFKTKVFTGKTAKELEALIDRSKDSLDEGFVLEDSYGQFLKVKLPIYKDIRVLREIYKKNDWDKIRIGDIHNKYNDLPITRSFLTTYTQDQFEALEGSNFVEKVHLTLESKGGF